MTTDTTISHSQGKRLTGGLTAAVAFTVVLLIFVVALDALGVEEKALLFIGQAFSYSAIGMFFVGWRWPDTFVAPLKRFVILAYEVSSRLLKGAFDSAAQRAIFAVACVGLLPWFAFRLIRELWQSSGLGDYLSNTFIQPISPWFESGWWWYTKLEWYDWPVFPSLALMVVAVAWPVTGARVLNWVRGK